MSGPEATEQRVAAAARRLIESGEWPDATLERIAEAAELSRVTLHRHGLGREGVLAFLAADVAAAYRDAMWPVLTAAGTAAERLELALRTICDLADENLGVLQALDASTNAAVFHEDGGVEALTRTEFSGPLERILRDGLVDGTLRALDPAETATVLFNLVGWSFIHLRSSHHWSAERARSATLQIVLSGVKAS